MAGYFAGGRVENAILFGIDDHGAYKEGEDQFGGYCICLNEH